MIFNSIVKTLIPRSLKKKESFQKIKFIWSFIFTIKNIKHKNLLAHKNRELQSNNIDLKHPTAHAY